MIKNLLLGLAAAAMLLPTPSLAQTNPNDSDKNTPEYRGFALNTTRAGETVTGNWNFLKYPSGSMWWINGGQEYKDGKKTADASVKYWKGPNLIRGTVSTDFTDGKRASGGVDWDYKVLEKGGLDFSLLGHGAVNRDYNFDGSLGVKVRNGKHHPFFLYTNNANVSYRIGYLNRNDEQPEEERTATGGYIEFPSGKNPVIFGYRGAPSYRVTVKMDTAEKELSTGLILPIGNEPLPLYARAFLIPGQRLFTARNDSLNDTDNKHDFQAPYFVYPKGRFSNVTKGRMINRPGKDEFQVYNAFGIKTVPGTLVLTQFYNTTDGWDVGAGFRFGGEETSFMPVFRIGPEGWTIDLAFTY